MDRARYVRFGIGPRDAYRGLWGLMLDAEKELSNIKPPSRQSGRTSKLAMKFGGRIGGHLKDLLPYERARLTQNTVRGDQKHPLVLVSPVDMKKLPV
jgi:hypothetical protein